MARLNVVKKSRKAYEEFGIKKGDMYYWWKFRFGGVHKSLIRPRRSQLTQSGFLGQVYDLEDEISETGEIDQSMIDGWVETIEALRDECQEKLDNMPEQLRENSSSGQLLQERVDALEQWTSDLEGIDCEVDEDALREEAEQDCLDKSEDGEDPDDRKQEIDDSLADKKQERYDEIKSEVESANPGF